MRINLNVSQIVSLDGTSYGSSNTKPLFSYNERNPYIDIKYDNKLIASPHWEDISFNDDSSPGIYTEPTFEDTVNEVNAYLMQ